MLGGEGGCRMTGGRAQRGPGFIELRSSSTKRRLLACGLPVLQCGAAGHDLFANRGVSAHRFKRLSQRACHLRPKMTRLDCPAVPWSQPDNRLGPSRTSQISIRRFVNRYWGQACIRLHGIHFVEYVLESS